MLCILVCIKRISEMACASRTHLMLVRFESSSVLFHFEADDCTIPDELTLALDRGFAVEFAVYL